MGNRRQPFRFSMSESQYGASMQPIQKAIEISRPAAPAWMRYGIALLAGLSHMALVLTLALVGGVAV